MTCRSYLPEKFQELSRKGSFHWQTTDAGLPKAGFVPHDPSDRKTAFEGELFVENDLGGQLERLATSARRMRQADADPKLGVGSVDRDPGPGQVVIDGQRNEHWDGAHRSSSGCQFSGRLKFQAGAEPSSCLARAFGLEGVSELKTLVVSHEVDSSYCREVELLSNTPQEIRVQVVEGGSLAPGAESYVLRLGPRGALFVEEGSN
jgi:hypothetical protein